MIFQAVCGCIVFTTSTSQVIQKMRNSTATRLLTCLPLCTSPSAGCLLLCSSLHSYCVAAVSVSALNCVRIHARRMWRRPLECILSPNTLRNVESSKTVDNSKWQKLAPGGPSLGCPRIHLHHMAKLCICPT